MATELIFNGVFTTLSALPTNLIQTIYNSEPTTHFSYLFTPAPPEAAALLSSLVLQERSDVAPGPLPPALDAACKTALETAQRLGAEQASQGVPIDPEQYVKDTLKFGLVEAVHAWACGATFLEVAQLTDIPEGTVVRTLVRLHETCRELRSVAGLLGDGSLSTLAEEAAAALKRDIVFASSLYVAQE